jgi:predicted regulator of Ras-like GTPase activity (Roadblock/LC7/MglB family)
MNSQSAQLVRQTLLLSLVLVIIPMIVFPAKVGTELATFSVAALLVEWAIYVMVLRVMSLRANLSQLMGLAVGCMIYRLAMGAVLGVLLSVGYRIGLLNAIQLGTTGYLPAVLLHVGVTPFVLRSALEYIIGGRAPITRVESQPAAASTSDDQVVAAVQVMQGVASPEAPAKASPRPAEGTSEQMTVGATTNDNLGDVNGFERATRYIGEDGSVRLALVVDNEGLTVSQFARGQIDPEEWAPLAQLFLENNERVLSRVRQSWPEKVDIALPDQRVVVVKEGAFSLMVLAERQSDELLRIRIKQALEGIRKHVAARYGRQDEVENREHTHAASTQ